MEYNIILGIDWLSTYHASVDCYKKRVIFKMKGVPEFIFAGAIDKQNMLKIQP